VVLGRHPGALEINGAAPEKSIKHPSAAPRLMDQFRAEPVGPRRWCAPSRRRCLRRARRCVFAVLSARGGVDSGDNRDRRLDNKLSQRPRRR